MGRRKIEIKAIKDDRNRSVTFLKRKGGLFKKAHELSVLCSVDVAVFIFGNNKKLYEYSSADMRELIHRYQYHGGPSEHKGPADFNGGNDDDDEEEGDGTPPHGSEVVENQMMPPHPYGQHQPPFPQIRHQTPSASPPIGNGGGPFQAHPGHPVQRTHTPQPSIGSRPTSRNDMRRMGPGMVQPPPPPGPQHPAMNYMATPPIYNSPHPPSGLLPQHAPHPQYGYHQQPPPMPQHQQHPQHQPQHQQQHQQHQPHQPGPYMEDRRSPMPSPMPPAYSSQPPSQGIQAPARPTPSPQPNQQQHPTSTYSQMSPPPPQPERRLQDLPPPPPPPVEVKTEPQERPQPPLLNTDSAIKKLPQRKSHSIFTPIEENRSILSQHLASFTESGKSESAAAAAAANAANAANRSQSVDVAALNRAADASKSSPHMPQRASTQTDSKRTGSLSSIPESAPTPPSRSNSAKLPGGPGGARPRGPRLTVQIPDGGSEGGGSARTAESNSPRNPAETTTQVPQRHNSQSSLVLPPPSPSASAILSAGATGPPNPFARPPPQQNVNGETPVSALPSRFLTNELLPSPSSFYPDWNFRGGDSNTLPSPLNFATPVVGSGPSFLRDDTLNTTPNANSSILKELKDPTPNVNGTSSQNLSVSNHSTATKRKTPELGATTQSDASEESDAKRLRVE
ncbi:hypothetical protein HYE67_005794 [Fusarium culmorum]|uniref:MADS-box MEF2 type transcription factor MIG1 n=1 Tax=Fusarium culmorum TaxID=5516 RepID=A0A2T4GCN0_FUSCU|nr:Transcription factor RLM1 [Fusarium culmorum]QPC63563.1 hypothetical protein HYE67_005794 [Fusarium culmorum]